MNSQGSATDGSGQRALTKLPMDFDFYLTHKMSETNFIKPWRLYVPKGI